MTRVDEIKMEMYQKEANGLPHILHVVLTGESNSNSHLHVVL